jgi:hypothetical protein
MAWDPTDYKDMLDDDYDDYYEKVKNFIFKQQERITIDYGYAARYIAKLLDNPNAKVAIAKVLSENGYAENIVTKIMDVAYLTLWEEKEQE